MTVQPEAPQAAGGSPELPTATPSSSSRSGQRAYLQSLERSSRAWLLSSGKPQGSSGTLRLSEETGSNIWYNPIPEEEDAGGPPAAVEIWRRREEVTKSPPPKRAGPGDADGSEAPDGSRPPGEGPDPGPRPEDCREDAGEQTGCLCWASGSVSCSLLLSWVQTAPPQTTAPRPRRSWLTGCGLQAP